jgi:hypothetical protein
MDLKSIFTAPFFNLRQSLTKRHQQRLTSGAAASRQALLPPLGPQKALVEQALHSCLPSRWALPAEAEARMPQWGSAQGGEQVSCEGEKSEGGLSPRTREEHGTHLSSPKRRGGLSGSLSDCAGGQRHKRVT